MGLVALPIFTNGTQKPYFDSDSGARLCGQLLPGRGSEGHDGGSGSSASSRWLLTPTSLGATRTSVFWVPNNFRGVGHRVQLRIYI